MTDYHSEIDRLLGERRPDRYEPDGGDEWLDLIADEIQYLIPESEARAIVARQAVRRRETDKLRAANRLLREIYDSKQLPVDWLDTMSLPMGVAKERVALRAARPGDFRNFANEERRRAAADFASRNRTCEAAEWIADCMEVGGVKFGRDINILEGAA